MAKGKGKGKKDKGVKGDYDGLKGEEARKQAMEEARQKAKEKIAIEEQNYKVNELKIQTRWREIMKQGSRFNIAKTEEVRKQIETLQQVHSRHLDRKTLILNNLDKDLEESEEQYSTAIQAHLISVDTLIDLQNQRLDNLRSQFDADVSLLDTEFNTERFLF